MTKSSIRIIKGNRDRTIDPSAALLITPNSEAMKLRDLADTVNLWIVERTENRRVEGVFSDGKIRAWKLIQEK
jgi:hypothetical protein